MTPGEYADQLRANLNLLLRENRPLQLAAYSVAGMISERVFTDGQNEKGERFQYKSPRYKKYRAKRGRETSFVNWQLEGDLKSDYENSPKGSSGQNRPLRINVNEYRSQLTRDINQLKYEGLSARFGEFLTANNQEEKEFFEIVEKELRLLFEP